MRRKNNSSESWQVHGLQVILPVKYFNGNHQKIRRDNFLAKARELNKILGKHIEDGKFKTSYKLINQIEGSPGSIMDNIAEGFERSGNREFLPSLYISKGSCGEFRSQLYRALDRGYLVQNEFDELYTWQWKQ